MNGKGKSKAELGAIPSPYNFVPLADHVFEPAWGARVCLDIPFRDGLSGRIAFTIEAHTPILVCGEQPEPSDGEVAEKRFFRLADGTPVVPGSTLRGLVRTVLEIAAFGAMRFVDDRIFGVRDLTDAAKPFYRDHLANVRAGFLRLDRETGSWRLVPCQWAQIPFTELIRELEGKGASTDWLWQRSTARERYQKWMKTGLGLDWKVRVQDGDRPLATFAPEGEDARLVFTGNTGVKNEKRRKKHEFVFYGGEDKEIEVPPAAWNAFLSVHEQNEDWKEWWLKRLRAGEIDEIPVFWIPDEEGRPWRLGLARMFRLAYENSVHACIRRAGERHLAPDVLDLPALLFGRAGDPERNIHPLAGRVVFSHAKAVGEPQELDPTETVPGAPKPSFYPNYVVQPTPEGDPGRLKGDTYATYTPLPEHRLDELAKPRIRGWKRYPVRPPEPVRVPQPPQGSSEKARVCLYPLAEGTRFAGEVRFHNLRPEELGALVWALTWGGRGSLRHALGMGRPYGWGQVSFHLDTCEIEPNDPRAEPPSVESCRDAFVRLMDGWCREKFGCGWLATDPMVQLLAMADPDKAGPKKKFPGEIRYPKLEVRGVDEFRAAKKAHLVLAPFWPSAPTSSDPFAPDSRVRHRPSGRRGHVIAPYRGRLLVRFDDGERMIVSPEDLERS